MSQDNIIPITRQATAVNPLNPSTVPTRLDSKFPTEVIDIPSRGHFYSENNPLSSGKLEIKMMSAKEEDILSSQNLVQKGIALDKVLESLIVDKTIDASKMLTCDQTAAFYAIRRLAYGDEYNAVLTCGRCGKENQVSIDLSKMAASEFDFSQYPKGENNFSFELPTSKVKLNFKMFTRADEVAVEQELKAMEKISKEVNRELSTRLIHMITAVDGDSSKDRIRKFVTNELFAKDSLAFRKNLLTLPRLNTSFDFTCQFCGLERKEETPMGVNFFWPNE